MIIVGGLLGGLLACWGAARVATASGIEGGEGWPRLAKAAGPGSRQDWQAGPRHGLRPSALYARPRVGAGWGGVAIRLRLALDKCAASPDEFLAATAIRRRTTRPPAPPPANAAEYVGQWWPPVGPPRRPEGGGLRAPEAADLRVRAPRRARSFSYSSCIHVSASSLRPLPPPARGSQGLAQGAAGWPTALKRIEDEFAHCPRRSLFSNRCREAATHPEPGASVTQPAQPRCHAARWIPADVRLPLPLRLAAGLARALRGLRATLFISPPPRPAAAVPACLN